MYANEAEKVILTCCILNAYARPNNKCEPCDVTIIHFYSLFTDSFGHITTLFFGENFLLFVINAYPNEHLD